MLWFFFLTSVVSADDVENCPPNLIRGNNLVAHNGLCYEFITLHKDNWEHANHDCVSKGGHLVVIRSAEENLFLMNTMRSLNFHGGSAWIGLTDKAQEGTFVWTTGEYVSFANWASGQPSLLLGDDQDCVVMKYSESGHWHDYPCTTSITHLIPHNYPWICEYKTEANLTAADDVKNCPPNLIRGNNLVAHNGLCYEFITHHKDNWEHANHDCISKGGHLVVIRSAEENLFLINTMRSLNFHGGSAWIGLNDRDQEGSFVWTTGEYLSFANWGAGQPSLLRGANEDCVVLKYSESGRWSDYPCSTNIFSPIPHNYPWICEYKQQIMTVLTTEAPTTTVANPTAAPPLKFHTIMGPLP